MIGMGILIKYHRNEDNTPSSTPSLSKRNHDTLSDEDGGGGGGAGSKKTRSG